MSMKPQLPDELEIVGEEWDMWLKIPKNIWKKIGWELENGAAITVCEEYDENGEFSHKSISVENEKHYLKGKTEIRRRSKK